MPHLTSPRLLGVVVGAGRNRLVSTGIDRVRRAVTGPAPTPVGAEVTMEADEFIPFDTTPAVPRTSGP